MYLFHLLPIKFRTDTKTTYKSYTTKCTNPSPWTNSAPAL